MNLTSCIVRRLHCVTCEARWSWLDATIPAYCPYCAAVLASAVAISKTAIKIAPDWPRNRKA